MILPPYTWHGENIETISINETRFKHAKFGLLGAFGLKKKHFHRFKTASNQKIIWSDKLGGVAGGSHQDSEEKRKILHEFVIVEKFFLDKQLFVGYRGVIDPCKPMRGILREDCSVKLELSSRNRKFNFKVCLAYFDMNEVLELLLFCDLDSIGLDDLIFLKQAKWYRSEAEGWRMIAPYSDGSHCRTIADLCAVILASCQLDTSALQQQGWPFFDFIEIENVRPCKSVQLKADHVLSDREFFGLVTGDEGYRLVDVKADYVKSVIDDKKMQFVGRKYFFYQFSLTSCVGFFSKDRHLVRKKWSDKYRYSVGYIPSLFEYTGFKNSVPCIQDGILLLVERCLLRYVKLHQLYSSLEAGRLAQHWLKKKCRWIGSIWREPGLFKELDTLDIIIDNALWIIAHGYEELLFGYNNLRDKVDRCIERRSKHFYQTVILIITIVGVVLAFFQIIGRV